MTTSLLEDRTRDQLWSGPVIDCDVHACVPSLEALFPYQDPVWVEAARERGYRGPPGLSLIYPPLAPTTARTEWRPSDGRVPASELGLLQEHILDPWRVERAIVNCYYSVDSLRHPDWAIALARSINDWLIDQWLDKDPRLSASLVIPARDSAAAAAEIDRVGKHPGFVQVLLPVRSERLYGQRVFWPLFEAIERNNLVAGLHCGGLAEHGPTRTGYASWYVEEYAEEPQVFGAQLTSMIVEGLFQKTGRLTVDGITEIDRMVTEKLAIIDADFHPMPTPADKQVAEHMSKLWRDYVATYGMGHSYSGLYAPAQREFTHRLDAIKDNRVGIDPLWAREQVLDLYDISGAVLTCPQSYILNSGGNMPEELSRELAQAFNNALAYTWMEADPRYYAAIVVPRDMPNVVDEIRRCKEGPYGDRFVSILMSPAGQEPMGRQRYWDIFEAATHYDIPVTFHVPGMGRQITGAGNTNFYGEMHMNFASLPMTLIPSLIFEGVFERFPTLRIALIELGWSWAVPYSWRLDATWAKLRDEVPHLKRKPSDYMREHVWFTTQPIEEPERKQDTESVYEMFEEAGFAERLMFSSDYPHWDFDSPYKSVPASFPIERRRRMLGRNASQLFKIPLRPNSGIPANALDG